MRLKGILILSLLSCFFAAAQQKQIKFDHLQNKNGLSQSNVLCILQDSRGFMWFGTRDGLNKYDGYKFTVYKNEPGNKKSISSSFITDMLEDAKGNIWIATRGGGISRFDRSKNLFYNYTHDNKNNNSIAGNNITTIALDKSGNIWIGTDGNGLDYFNTAQQKFQHFCNGGGKNCINDNFIRDVFVDSKGKVWVGTETGGLNIYDPHTKAFTNYKNDPLNKSSLNCNDVYILYEDYQHKMWVGTNGGGVSTFDEETNSFISYKNDTRDVNGQAKNNIYSLNEDRNHNLWIGTENGGLSILNRPTNTFKNYLHDDIDNNSLSSNSIYAICRDTKGNMWVGTFNSGIDLYNRDNLFMQYNHSLSPKSLSDNRVLCIFEDSKKNIWVGTDGGGLNLMDRTTDTFAHFKYDAKNSNSLCGNYVLSICEDTLNNLWIGTWGDGISVYNPKTKKYKHYKNSTDKNSLSNNNAWTIYKDKEGTIWIGTIGGGLNKFNYATNSFEHLSYNPNNKNGLNSNNIECMFDDGKGNLWIGTDGGGLNILNKATSQIKHFTHSNDSNSIASNTINNIYEDSKGRYWLATSVGLSLLNTKTNTFKNYTIKDGLPGNQVFGIMEDNKQLIWVSTSNGLCKIDIEKSKFKNYSMEDGLQGNEFKERAFCKSSSGALYFGGNNGFNAFYPYMIAKPSYDPPLVMTALRLSNVDVPIAISDTDQSPLKQDISETKQLTLSYKNSVIRFEFASLNYTSTEKKQYAYMLKGFDEKFTDFSQRRSATYTNLDPGNYIFIVRSLNDNGKISSQELTLHLTITPPFWKTWWFRLSVVALCTFSIYFVYRYRINKEIKTQLILEQQVADRTKKLNLSTQQERAAREDAETARKQAEEASKAKSIFLATMSHEIRTPMNGLIGMSTLLSQTQLTPKQKEYTEVIRICGDTLLNVINDILDFSKIESGNMTIEENEFDLHDCIEDVLNIFGEKAAKNGIDLLYRIGNDVPAFIIGDRLRLRQVLMNLVSNAIKFTPSGEVLILVDKQPSDDGTTVLSFKVKDTGIGIPADKLEKLFKAFSQVDSSTTRKYGGTGLGLIICEKLVQLMNGEISVASEVGKGSIFTFSIQTKAAQKSNKNICKTSPELIGKRVLIVDDNNTNRTILHDQLLQWNITPFSAANAYDALSMLSKHSYDLILTDMEMPGMDGEEFTKLAKKINANIPVILLTSLNNDINHASQKLFSAIITKPVRLNALYKEIESVLQDTETIITETITTDTDSDIIEETPLLASKYPLNILLAEDDMFNQMIAVQLLETLGYEITVADNGKIAVQQLQQQNFDLVFMDIQMPEMDGYQATKFIRSNLNDQPVILAMTANAMDGDKEKCINAGMNDYISKPINFEELSEKLEIWAKQIHLQKQTAIAL